jgi:hypothetical protein
MVETYKAKSDGIVIVRLANFIRMFPDQAQVEPVRYE